MKVVCVSGTPGVGKTTISKKIASRFGFKYIDVNRVVVKHGLGEVFDGRGRGDPHPRQSGNRLGWLWVRSGVDDLQLYTQSQTGLQTRACLKTAPFSGGVA